MLPIANKLRLAGGFGESLALSRFQQEMRRQAGGFVRYCGIGHGGHAISEWIKTDLTENTTTLSCTTNGTTTVTTASTAGLVANTGITGTHIPWGTQISSVDSGTNLTLSAAATGSGTVNLQFSNLTQDKNAFDGLTCQELLLFICQGVNNVSASPLIATYSTQFDAWINYLKSATGASVAYWVYLLPIHVSPHGSNVYYDTVGESGYDLRVLMTAKAAASGGLGAVYNSDSLDRSPDGVHLNSQQENTLLARGMWNTMLSLLD